LRHAATFPAGGDGSQAEWVDRACANSLTARSSRSLKIPSISECRFMQIPEIQSQRMRRYKLWPATVPFFFVFALTAGQAGQGQADEGNIFIIAAADGYGVEDCLGEGGECGRVVADAWCEAHGHGAAIAFGPADDVTDGIPMGAAANKSQRPYIVRCGD